MGDLDVAQPAAVRQTLLSHPKCTTAVRQTALSRDGSILLCVCDDGTIWRWDKEKRKKVNDDHGVVSYLISLKCENVKHIWCCLCMGCPQTDHCRWGVQWTHCQLSLNN